MKTTAAKAIGKPDHGFAPVVLANIQPARDRVARPPMMWRVVRLNVSTGR
jgi:hypothetical protein